MARGKHKAKSANRRRAQAQSVIEQLRAELESERQLLADVAEAREEARQARSRVHDETVDLVESSRPQVERLESEIEYLKDVLVRLRGEQHAVKQAWGKYVEHCVSVSPGRSHTERVEAFVASLQGAPMVYMQGATTSGLDTEQYLNLQRSRKERATVPDDPEVRAKNLAVISEWFPPDLWRRLNEARLVNEDGEIIHDPEDLSDEQGQVLLDVVEVAGKMRRSAPPVVDPDCLSIWGPGPLVRRSWRNNATMTRLGVDDAPQPTRAEQHDGKAPTLPLPSLSSKGRTLVAGMHPSEVVDTWRHALRTREAVTKAVAGDASPLMSMPHHSRPSQGVVLQHLYSLSALGEWVRAGQGLSTEAAVATGLTSAAAYWLPAGQTSSFADSDPVDEEAKAEMLMPFPQVFLAFAEPLVLEPSGPLDSHLATAVRAMSLSARSSKKSLSSSAGSILHEVRRNIAGGEIPFVEDILAQRGAKVEGVLLLSDDLSRPTDEFAWCLSLGSDYGESLGRIAVPARRSLTAHSDLIENLTAVVAWANWHEPDSLTEIPLGMKPDDVDRIIKSDDFKNDAQRAGAGVRVIDAVRTSRGGTRAKTGEGRHVDPHIRRGHWRKQRHGPGRSKIKMVRISPTLVNAHMGDIGPRVYRLQ